jgi:hypothetical protein
MPLGLAIGRLVKQLRGLVADARARGAESVETLVLLDRSLSGQSSRQLVRDR